MIKKAINKTIEEVKVSKKHNNYMSHVYAYSLKLGIKYLILIGLLAVLSFLMYLAENNLYLHLFVAVINIIYSITVLYVGLKDVIIMVKLSKIDAKERGRG